MNNMKSSSPYQSSSSVDFGSTGSSSTLLDRGLDHLLREVGGDTHNSLLVFKSKNASSNSSSHSHSSSGEDIGSRSSDCLVVDEEIARCLPSNGVIEPKNKDDGRLFQENLLYCEGEPKPSLRGKLHMFCSFLLPLGIFHLYVEANGLLGGQIAGIFYVLTNLLSYGFSALFHVGKWSVQVEIWMQKLDHCCIALLSVGTMMPLAFLLLPQPVGWSFAAILFSLLGWNVYHIVNCRPSVIRQVMVPMTILPYLPTCYTYMNSIEWNCCLGCIFFQVCGVYVFANKKGNFIANVFGYHELFHIFVVAAGICVYIANWSIVRRTCNPYAHHIDVTEVLLHTLGIEKSVE